MRPMYRYANDYAAEPAPLRPVPPTQTASSNEQMLREGYAVFHTGDLEKTLGFFADDIVWEVGGRHLVSGTRQGKDEVHEFLATIFELTAGTVRFEILDVLTNDRRGVVLLSAMGKRNGRSWDTQVIHLWEIRDGKLAAFRHIALDQYADDEFWS